MPDNIETFDKKRYYTAGSMKWPSVTTILDIAFQKEWLNRWIAKKIAEEAAKDASLSPEELLVAADRTRIKSADHGDDVHDRLLRLGKGLEPDFKPIEQWNQLYKPEILFSEATVINEAVGYAGTMDMIAIINRKTYLLDLKTGNFLNETVRLQLSAYKNAEMIVAGWTKQNLPIKMPNIDACAILWIPRDNPDQWSFREISVGHREYQAFLSCVDVANYHIGSSGRSVVGKVVSHA